MARDHVEHQMNVDRIRNAVRAAYRMRMIAQASLIAFLAASCAGGSGDNLGGGNGSEGGKPQLPVPAEFRSRVSQLVREKKLAEATALINGASPELLARAASEKADIVYFVVMGIGPITPGIEPRPKPNRTWIFPGTSDVRNGKEDEAYQLAAYNFAKAYNAALAKEEHGVK